MWGGGGHRVDEGLQSLSEDMHFLFGGWKSRTKHSDIHKSTKPFTVEILILCMNKHQLCEIFIEKNKPEGSVQDNLVHHLLKVMVSLAYFILWSSQLWN